MNLSRSAALNAQMSTKELYQGIKAGIPICIGYLPIAMAFGLLAKGAGLSVTGGTLMSALVFAGASQFVAVNMLSLDMGLIQIILTTFILNFRHFLMSASLTQRLKTDKPFWLWLVGFGITDETFAVATLQEKKNLSPFYLLGLNFSAYVSWVFGTTSGFIIADSLPEVVQSSMGIALYAMFIGLLMPSVKKSRSVGAVALLGALFNIIFSRFIAPGWALVLAAILGALAATFFLKKEV